MAEPVQIGILLYPNVTQLDATGPAQVLCRVPGAKLHMIWKTRDPVPTDAGFSDRADHDLRRLPAARRDLRAGRWRPGRADGRSRDARLPAQAGGWARYVTSVCTGSLVLGAAGLLKGYKSACHWAWRDMLKDFGAIPVAERVVRDRNPHLGRWRDGRHRFRPHGRSRTGGRGGRQVDPARARIRSAAALRLGFRPRRPAPSGEGIRERLAPLLESRRKANVEAAARMQ